MTPTPSGRLIAVRVGADESIVAVVDPVGPRLERAIRVPGGLRAVDDRIAELVAAEVPGGLPTGSTPQLAAAASRLRDAVTAARVRLVDDASTTVSVRYPGRMTFVTLDRGAAVAALDAELAGILAAAGEVGLAPRTALLALDGVASVPGLLEALPGRLVAVARMRAAGIATLLYEDDAGSESPAAAKPELDAEADPQPEPESEPTAEAPAAAAPIDEADPSATAEAGPAPASAAPRTDRPTTATPMNPLSADSGLRAAVVLRRAWPVAASVVVILGLGSAAAAVGLGTTSPTGGLRDAPASTRTRDQHDPGPSSGPVVPSSSPVAPAAPPAAPGGAGQGGPSTQKPKTATKPGAGGSGGAAAPAPAPPSTGVSPDPGTGGSTPTPAPSGTPTDPPSPTPSPTDPSDPVGGILQPILP